MQEAKQIFVTNKEDRRQMAGILVENGYVVKVTKVKVGNSLKPVIEYYREDGK